MGLMQTTGEAKFAGDIKLVGMHHAALVTSTHAHAKLLAVDASAALQVQIATPKKQPPNWAAFGE